MAATSTCSHCYTGTVATQEHVWYNLLKRNFMYDVNVFDNTERKEHYLALLHLTYESSSHHVARAIPTPQIHMSSKVMLNNMPKYVAL